MKKNNHISKLIGTSVIALLVISSFTAIAIDTFEEKNKLNESYNRDSLPYEGTLRIYVAEPISRWDHSGNEPYHFGSLDIIKEDLNIDYLGNYQDTINWNGEIYEDNIIVMAAVFNPESHDAYAYPPSSNPFNAYYVDAATAAMPGETSYNTVIENFTHTVFAEEGTATWCGYCPDMAEALYNIYHSDDYPFYYVALVDDMNSDAANRLRNDYNIYGFPTAFFDGGYKLHVGGGSPENSCRSKIESSGRRDVHELNLTLSVVWLGGGNLQIDVSITNNEAMNPPETPNVPSGPTNGNVDIEYTYTANTTDPNEDKIYYLFDWGDGSDSGWIGPFSSGATANAKHIWEEEGDYEVKVKAKDTGGGGHESDWSDPLLIHIGPPEFLITITGEPFSVVAYIKNNGEEELPKVDWSVTVTGGLLDRINSYSEGTTENLEPEEEIIARTNQTIFGLGRIEIIVTAETTIITTNGFVIGPFILVLN